MVEMSDVSIVTVVIMWNVRRVMSIHNQIKDTCTLCKEIKSISYFTYRTKQICCECATYLREGIRHKKHTIHGKDLIEEKTI